MKVKLQNESKSASTKPFAPLTFDSTEVGQVKVQGVDYDQVKFKSSAEVLKTLGGSGLARVILVDDGGRTVGAALKSSLKLGDDVKDIDVLPPSKGGTIEGIEMAAEDRVRMGNAILAAAKTTSALKYATELISGATKPVNVYIKGWTSADFVRQAV